MIHETDYDLIKRYLEGNDSSLDILVKRYLDPIYRFVFTYVKDPQAAQDVTQEVFLKAWRNLKKIEKDKNFKSWLYTVAKNTALDHLKKKTSVPFSNFETDDNKNLLAERLADSAILPDRAAMAAETALAMSAALEQLSEKYKLVLRMYYYEYLNFREIAELLNESINTIKSRHRRGVMLLEKILSGQTR